MLLNLVFILTTSIAIFEMTQISQIRVGDLENNRSINLTDLQIQHTELKIF